MTDVSSSGPRPIHTGPIIAPAQQRVTFADRNVKAYPAQSDKLLKRTGSSSGSYPVPATKPPIGERRTASKQGRDHSDIEDNGADSAFETEPVSSFSSDSSDISRADRDRVHSDFSDDESCEEGLNEFDSENASLTIETDFDPQSASLSIEGGEPVEEIEQPKSVLNTIKTGLQKLWKSVVDFASKHKIAIGLALSILFVLIMVSPAGPAIVGSLFGAALIASLGASIACAFVGALIVDLVGGLGPDAQQVPQPQPNSGQNQNESGNEKSTARTENNADRLNKSSQVDDGTDGSFYLKPTPGSAGQVTSASGAQTTATTGSQYAQGAAPFSLKAIDDWVSTHILQWANEERFDEFKTLQYAQYAIGEPEDSEAFRQSFSRDALQLLKTVKAPMRKERGGTRYQQNERLGVVKDFMSTILEKMDVTPQYLSEMTLNLGKAVKDYKYFTGDVNAAYLSIDVARDSAPLANMSPDEMAELEATELLRAVQQALMEESGRRNQEPGWRPYVSNLPFSPALMPGFSEGSESEEGSVVSEEVVTNKSREASTAGLNAGKGGAIDTRDLQKTTKEMATNDHIDTKDISTQALADTNKVRPPLPEIEESFFPEDDVTLDIDLNLDDLSYYKTLLIRFMCQVDVCCDDWKSEKKLERFDDNGLKAADLEDVMKDLPKAIKQAGKDFIMSKSRDTYNKLAELREKQARGEELSPEYEEGKIIWEGHIKNKQNFLNYVFQDSIVDQAFLGKSVDSEEKELILSVFEESLETKWNI